MSAAAAAAAAVDDEMHVNSNDQNNFYFAFFSDISNKFKISGQASAPTAYLGSSTTVDLLTLMHNRTGHGNMRMLIEASKSKLVSVV